MLTGDPVAKVVIHPHRHRQYLLVAEDQEPEGGGISGDRGKETLIKEIPELEEVA